MIEGLKPYPEYKEAGLPWLGSIPRHWEMIPNRALMKERKETVGHNAGKHKLLSLTLRGVIPRDMDNPKGKFPAEFTTYKVVEPGDFVFCLFDVDETPRGVGLSGDKGMITGAYDIFRATSQIKPMYLLHYYLFIDQGKLMKPFYRGLRKTIPGPIFAGLKSPVPPPDEQAAIVRFLDHANRKIDGFIRAKRKLIGLLNEQKQAIIHRAVTRGLNPDAPLKPSGIPWLGDIPAHWEVRRLRFCIRGKLTYGANAAAEFDNPEWPRYLRITDFRSDGSLRSDTFRSLPPEVAKDFPVEDGDLLLARSGATVGKAFIVRTDSVKACFAGYLIRARPNTEIILPTFFFAFTQSTAFACWKDAIFSRATIQNIGADKYANLVVPIPSIPEQQAILDVVERDLEPLRVAISRTEREIALMQEYRTRLTADVVTGKLDVREAASSLPEVSEGIPEGMDRGVDEAETELAETEG